MNKLAWILIILLLAINVPAQVRVIEKPVKNTYSLQRMPPFDISSVRACRDVIPMGGNALPPRAATNSYTIYKIDTNGVIGPVVIKRQPLATITNQMWEPGRTLKVGFDITGVNINVIPVVKQYAIEWEQVANIKWEFVTDMRTADIRVGFLPNGSYSYIGREAMNIPVTATTMNLGWITTATSSEARRVILHEFGHALGFIHEHNSPAVAIPWDREKAYAFYRQPPNNWNQAMVDLNIFSKYSATETNFSAYDRNSIMHYPIPPELTTDGSSIPFNSDLSPVDKLYAGYFYPFPPTSPTATGTLKTGDDCDRVDFIIEYNVVSSDKIEFQFSFGQFNSKKVSWWKQIGIPAPNNKETLIEIQNHSLIAAENKPSAIVQIPVTQINSQKAIRFWKAKLLGVHTPINYQWNVLPALRGGCRIQLVWSRDSCL